jgi:hypothetical protein
MKGTAMNACRIVLAVFLAHAFCFVPQTGFGQTDMSEDFLVKGLPASAVLPAENLDKAAESMAQQIARSDKQSLPVLLAALQTAGFSIIDENGIVLRKPAGGGPGQGLGFYDFEAVGSLKLETGGARISLAKFAGAITKEVSQIQASQFSEALVTDLRTQANNSNNRYLRYWARLIIELGKCSPQPVDMMTTPASRINLSVLQATLLVRRLQGDLYSLKRKFPKTGAIPPPFSQRQALVPVFWKTDDVPLVHLVKDSSKGALPCNLSGEYDGLILDATANGITYGFGKWMELLEVSEIAGISSKTLGFLSKGLGIAGAVLTGAELAAALTMLKGEMVVDNPPLIRTTTETAGEKRLMKAKLWFDVGKKQIVNCFRTAINSAFGLDFSVPNDGPAANAVVEWDIQEEEEFVWLEALEAKKGKDRSPSNQVTDNNGVSEMWLVGVPKNAPIAQKNPKKITKTAHVRVRARLKSAKDFVQNWIDIGGVILGGPMGGTVSAIEEIGFRLPYVVARATIPVIDHEPFVGYKPILKGVDFSSGVICSLEKPFTIAGSISNPGEYGVVTLKSFASFMPSSATTGTWMASNTTSNERITLNHEHPPSPYTIEGADTPTPRIKMIGPQATDYLDLVRLEIDECKEP